MTSEPHDRTVPVDFEVLPVAVRVWARRIEEKGDDATKPKSARKRGHRSPQRSLVFDTETTIDFTQKLNFGVYRYYIDRHDSLPGTVCVEEGILYADDLPDRYPEGFEVLYDYVENHSASVSRGRNRRLPLLSRTQFVEEVLYKRTADKASRIVGFNLPFDLSRIAVGASAARGRYYGGNSLRLFREERFRPRIAYRAFDSKSSLMGFTLPWDGHAKKKK